MFRDSRSTCTSLAAYCTRSFEKTRYKKKEAIKSLTKRTKRKTTDERMNSIRILCAHIGYATKQRNCNSHKLNNSGSEEKKYEGSAAMEVFTLYIYQKKSSATLLHKLTQKGASVGNVSRPWLIGNSSCVY